MNAQFLDTPAQFNAFPPAQAWLQNFLDSPRDQRQAMLEQMRGVPETAQFADHCRATG
jgi:hypothetical protein